VLADRGFEALHNHGEPRLRVLGLKLPRRDSEVDAVDRRQVGEGEGAISGSSGPTRSAKADSDTPVVRTVRDSTTRRDRPAAR